MRVLFAIFVLGIIIVVHGQTHSPSPSPSIASSASSDSVNSTYTQFICRQTNQYDFRTWIPLGNFLSLDYGIPANWTMTKTTATVTAKPNGLPAALLSPDVWTGRVSFSGYMLTQDVGDTRRLGFLFGVVSPQTKFILLEWSNDVSSIFGCVPPLVSTAWGRSLSGIVVRAIRNPLGNSALQQQCNLFSSVNQENVTTLWISEPNVARREIGTPYWFNLTMDTIGNTIDIVITKSFPNGTVLYNTTYLVADHDLSANFTLGRIGAFISGGAGQFYNWTVTPQTCTDNYYANCGYHCPMYNVTYSQAAGPYDSDEGPNEPLHWYAILLIILGILICCCLLCLIIAAVIVFLLRR